MDRDPLLPPILVATCGNRMAGDDAFGPLVAERLHQQPVAHVEVIDLGMKPAGLLSYLPNRSAVIIVDAAEPIDQVPSGTLIDVDFASADRPRLRHDVALSSHGLSIGHELELARQLGMLPPRVHLLAVTIGTADLGQPASDEILRLVPRVVQRIAALAGGERGCRR